MALKVYNTEKRKLEVFKSLKKGIVGIYVCGITPYDLSHVGHARSYVAFDVIRRSLEYLGYMVRYVQNFTDVDDKILKRAKIEKMDPLALSQGYMDDYFRDMDSLGIKRADAYPRVSEKIPQIIEVISTLVDKGRAYVSGGNVYLDLSKDSGYGRLSGQPIEELRAGARVEVDKNKRHPLDFALWKKAKPEEIAWLSPWGKGRPGWHIECSVMSMEALGETIDIHGGGQDLIFPHHENEIAQSEAFTGKPFVRYWLHNGLVTVEGKKMSKSLGNFITLRDLTNRYNPQVIRFFLLSAHYRKPLDFSERALKDARKGLLRIQNTIFNLKNSMEYASSKDSSEFREKIKLARRDFKSYLEDDFNIPRALAVLFDFLRDANTYLLEKPVKRDLEKALSAIKEFTEVLGLTFEEEIPELTKKLVSIIINMRSTLRDRKDYGSSDAIRERLEDIGIVLEDRIGGTVWMFKVPLESPQ